MLNCGELLGQQGRTTTTRGFFSDHTLLERLLIKREQKHLFLLGDFASSCSRALSFHLVDLSIGWNLLVLSARLGLWIDFLDILFYGLFGFGVFLDCRIYFLYCILYIGDSVFHLLYSVGYACICIS
ncbi:hypothetical protein STEG23_038224 [Scotinomys teguina]